MPKIAHQQDLLVIRPWVAQHSNGDCYAHFDALVMRRRGKAEPCRYGELDVLYQGDDERSTLFLDGFRFECQIDDRHAEAYAWRWGYNARHSGMFTADDIDRYSKSITAVRRGLDRFRQEDGEAESVGRYVVRLARILRVDGIVVIETRTTGGFGPSMVLRHRAAAPNYGAIAHRIDDLQRELHQQCAARLRSFAA